MIQMMDAWTRRADLPQALGGVALATANGKLYAFGGFDQRGYNQGNVAVTYEYNPATNKWRERAAAPVGTRSLAGAASLNGKIYVVGGITDGNVYTSTMGANDHLRSRRQYVAIWRACQPGSFVGVGGRAG